MRIDLDTLVLTIQREADERGLVFQADEIIGSEKDLEDIIFIAAAKFKRKPAVSEQQLRELITPGRLELGRLTAFLDALPGYEDSDIDDPPENDDFKIG